MPMDYFGLPGFGQQLSPEQYQALAMYQNALNQGAGGGSADTGAPFFGVGLPPQMLAQVTAHLPPAVAAHMQANLDPATILKLAPQLRPVVQAPSSALAQQRIHYAPHPVLAPSAIPSGRILSDEEFFKRCRIRQLASIGDGTTVGVVIPAGATVATFLEVTRDGTVIQFSVNDLASELIAQNLVYLQDPYEIYRAQNLGAWANKAAHKMPVMPKHVRSPIRFSVSITNPSATDDVRLVWTMEGIDDEDMSEYQSDPDLVATMRARGIPLGASMTINPLG